MSKQNTPNCTAAKMNLMKLVHTNPWQELAVEGNGRQSSAGYAGGVSCTGKPKRGRSVPKNAARSLGVSWTYPFLVQRGMRTYVHADMHMHVHTQTPLR